MYTIIFDTAQNNKESIKFEIECFKNSDKSANNKADFH
jgi:hypothetical protein